MTEEKISMRTTTKPGSVKRIVIVSDEKSRKDLIEWSYSYKHILSLHEIVTSAETAEILQGTLNKTIEPVEKIPGTSHRELAAIIRRGGADLVIFLSDTSATNIIESGAFKLHQLAIFHGIATVSGRTTAELLMPSLEIKDKAPSAILSVLNMIRHNVILMGGCRKWVAM